ncbi:hypothetical protein ACT3SY_03035 [Brachybacterium sp. AOP42-E1-35]|uniref:hypothetical protein n=1 Tax=unclassified Brachybacterium TaxID=2623841 RepID=UPI00402A83A1
MDQIILDHAVGRDGEPPQGEGVLVGSIAQGHGPCGIEQKAHQERFPQDRVDGEGHHDGREYPPSPNG